MKWVDTEENGLEKHNVTGTVKFGGGNIMIWGCMTWQGVGYAQIVEGKMNTKQNIDILDLSLGKTLEAYNLDIKDIIFQQDNDPKQTAKMTLKWFAEKAYIVLKLPAQSPDLSPIEHLWYHVKQELYKFDEDARSRDELIQRVSDIWEKIAPEVCQRLIESMPRRCATLSRSTPKPTHPPPRKR